ncbi:MAG: GTPase Era [Zoogloeaceae bacterium]|nr:GTPase Era [Zoogloeaceae bacterium]MCK6383576.1 GTPase Era [Rhodocyclaceae bacterium]
MSAPEEHRCGHLAIAGRPNVGKSTLLNRLIGRKISIVSRKAQTTRHRITGVLTRPGQQFVFVDTPGFQLRHKNALNRLMNRGVAQALVGVDVILLMIEAGRFNEDDKRILAMIPQGKTVLLVINKIDRLADKQRLLPFIAKVAGLYSFAEIVPVCAASGTGCGELLDAAARYLPESPPLFGEDDLTDRSERFLAAEFLREKLFRRLGEELPYGMTVEIERFEQEGALRRIHAAIIVDKPAHKAIVIGRGGEQLKAIASDARRDMEKLFDGKVFLEVWVKVKGGWTDDERALKSLGYE